MTSSTVVTEFELIIITFIILFTYNITLFILFTLFTSLIRQLLSLPALPKHRVTRDPNMGWAVSGLSKKGSAVTLCFGGVGRDNTCLIRDVNNVNNINNVIIIN